jgi:hypothetical protein
LTVVPVRLRGSRLVYETAAGCWAIRSDVGQLRVGEEDGGARRAPAHQHLGTVIGVGCLGDHVDGQLAALQPLARVPHAQVPSLAALGDPAAHLCLLRAVVLDRLGVERAFPEVEPLGQGVPVAVEPVDVRRARPALPAAARPAPGRDGVAQTGERDPDEGMPAVLVLGLDLADGCVDGQQLGGAPPEGTDEAHAVVESASQSCSPLK